MVSLEFLMHIILPAALWTQPLTEMSTRNISWRRGGGVKCGRFVWLANLPPSCADFLEVWEPQPPEPSGPAQDCKGITLPLHIKSQSSDS
jgi:hypothetical protein